jgi:hypothetical protein
MFFVLQESRDKCSFNRFAQKFAGKIANDDIVFFKKLVGKRDGDGEMDIGDMNDLIRDRHQDMDLDSHVENIVEQFFINARAAEDHSALLEILSERGLSEAVKVCVEKDDKDALTEMIENQMERVIAHLIRKDVTEVDIEEELDAFRKKRLAHPDEESAEVSAQCYIFC